jgi:predicted DsbA family dithiol-disulfide isomerase
MTLAIAITSDFICPWCLVADMRLKQAIKQLDLEVQISWFPFELNPTMPIAGMDRKTYRSQKFGSWEYSQQLDAKTVEATEADGIKFRYDLIEKTPNTVNAHRLTWFAGKKGKGAQMAEYILNAYFTKGEDIGDLKTLANLGRDMGLDGIEELLYSDQGIQEVRELEKQAISKGIRGVPAIRIGQETLSGAQPIEVFIAALNSAIN